MAIPFLKSSFAAGEVAPSFFGNVPNVHYSIGCSTCRNAFISYRGGAYSRAGTKFVGFSKQTGRAQPPRLVTFQFSILQGLDLEFGHEYMRVIQNGSYVTETPIAITAISQANPAVITATNSFANGDWVQLANIGGMLALDNLTFIVANRTSTTFEITDVYGTPINSVPFSAYTGGGTAARIYTLTTPYADVDLPYLKWAQSADVMTLCCWNQATGMSYPTIDLRRVANNNWNLTVTTFAATIGPPGTPTLVATHPAAQQGPTDTSAATYGYEITAVSSADGSESIASLPASVQSANIAVTSGSIKVSWAPAASAESYNIYKCQPIAGTTVAAPANFIPAGVLYGYAGTSIGTAFTDTNILPDFSQVPPRHLNPFAASAIIGITLTGNGAGGTSQPIITITTSTGSGAVLEAVFDPDAGTVTGVVIEDGGEGYAPSDTIAFSGGGFSPDATGTLVLGPATGVNPSVVSYFQQRRVYAATPNRPDTYFMSQPGAFTNMDSRIPTIDSDAIIGTPWSLQVNGIQFMVQMPAGLIALTGLGAWQVSGSGSSAYAIQAITPANQQAVPQAYNGCHTNIPPIKIENEVYYVQAKGSIIRDLSYNFFTNIYTGVDTTYLSSHLFNALNPNDQGGVVTEWAWAEEPYKIIWVGREDGTFLSYTTLKAQEVAAWTRHDTLGQVWSLSSVVEPPVDALYMAVERFPGDNIAFMIERMDDRLWGGVEDVWAVDSGLTLPAQTPNAFCQAVAASGNGVEVFSIPGVFNAGMVGQVLRVGGGVATIVGYSAANLITVDITTPIASLLPNGRPVQQPAGNWNIAPLVTQIGGLNHLFGSVVTGLADGVPLAPQFVHVLADGQVGITLATPASKVTVGLGFQVQVQSLYLDAGQPTIQGRRKKVARAVVRLESSLGVKVGANQPDGSVQSPAGLAPAWSNLSDVPSTGLVYPTAGGGQVAQLYTGDSQAITLMGGWAVPGQVAVQQDLPLPMNILAFVPDLLPGDLPEMEASPRRDNSRR